MKYINEHIVIKGSKTALLWIAKWLIEHSISFTYDNMTGFLTFVQNCPDDRTCGVLSTLQLIIGNCPCRSWDIVSQFSCSYSSILNQ
jgi:hypothetical protein